jgi:hypothetical protein
MRFFEAPPEDFHGKLPFVLTDLIAQLRCRNSRDVEGIFRLNGSDTEIRRLIDELNQGHVKDWSKYEDIHIAACALKRYFRVMSEREPIVPREVVPCLIAAMGLKVSMEGVLQQQRSLIHKIVAMIPPIRALALGYLIQYLHDVSLNSEVNRMTPANLGICFGPNFFGDDVLSPDKAMQDQTLLNTAVAMMIEWFSEAFKAFRFTDDLIMTDEDFQELSRPPVNIQHVLGQELRCKSRHGKAIPFVPLCRLVREWDPPTRAPYAQLEEDDSELSAFGRELKSRAGGNRAIYRASMALVNDVFQNSDGHQSHNGP